MLVPSKFTRLEESTIFKMRFILAGKIEGESISDIYFRTKSKFTDASELLHALDILYVIGLIDENKKTGLIEYA